jgi:type II secretion system protein G
MLMRSASAFTLIELLIVVLIIAILAAIAVPNFLEAQTRAKVSRARGDMRNLATALEAYCADNAKYPIPHPHRPATATNLSGTNVPNELSTPISYISNTKAFFDPFSKTYEWVSQGLYNRYGYITDDVPDLHSWAALESTYRLAVGKWRMDSFGPDECSAPSKGALSNWPNEPSYDPTNGSISRGDIYRSQRNAEHTQIVP